MGLHVSNEVSRRHRVLLQEVAHANLPPAEGRILIQDGGSRFRADTSELAWPNGERCAENGASDATLMAIAGPHAPEKSETL